MSEFHKFIAGERAVICSRHREAGRIVTVERVTPTGRIIAGGLTFKSNGRLIGGYSFSNTRIEQLTEEKRAQIIRLTRLNQISSFSFSTLSDSEIEAVLNIISKSKEPSK